MDGKTNQAQKAMLINSDPKAYLQGELLKRAYCGILVLTYLLMTIINEDG